MRKLAGILVAVVFAGVACWPFSGDATLTEMELSAERGDVHVVRAGRVLEVGDRLALEPGDVVHAAKGALAAMRLEGARAVEIAGFDGEARARIVDGSTLEAQLGSLKATVGDVTRVRVGSVVVSGRDAVMRVDRGFASARAAAYEGAISVAAPGETTLRVGRLFEAPVAAADLPNAPDPYRVDVADLWDRQHLRTIVVLDEDLGQLSAGVANQFGRRPPSMTYFRALADGADVDFVRRYLTKASGVDLVVAFNIAMQARRPLHKAFSRAFQLFERGASWGVVAALLDVSFRPLVARIDRVIGASTLVAARSGAKPAFSAAAAEEAVGGRRGGRGGRGQARPDGNGGGGPAPDGGGGGGSRPEERGEKPPTDPPEDDCADATNAVDCIVDGLQPPALDQP